MNKGLIKLLPENTILEKIGCFEFEGTYDELLDSDTNDHVVIFPLIRTKRNDDSYDASLFYVITRAGCHPSSYDNLILCYRYYTVSNKLELALNYANNTGDWADAIEIDMDDLDMEEIDFIRNWFVGQADEKIAKFAKDTYGLTEDNYIACNFDIIKTQGFIRWYEKENKCFKLVMGSIFDLNNLSKIVCEIYKKTEVIL